MNNDHTGALLEDIQDKLTRFSEAMADVPSKVQSMDERLVRVEEKVDALTAAVPDLSSQVTDHEHRLTKLEATG